MKRGNEKANCEASEGSLYETVFIGPAFENSISKEFASPTNRSAGLNSSAIQERSKNFSRFENLA